MAKKSSKKKSGNKKKGLSDGAKIAVWAVVLVLVVAASYLITKDLTGPETYTYNNFEFVETADGFWTTTVEVDGVLYAPEFKYGPRELEGFKITYLNNSFATRMGQVPMLYISTNPEYGNQSYYAVAAYNLGATIARVWGVEPVAAHLKNSSKSYDVPIITCKRTIASTIMIIPADEPSITYKDNCLTITGQREDIVKASERVILGWYGVMD